LEEFLLNGQEVRKHEVFCVDRNRQVVGFVPPEEVEDLLAELEASWKDCRLEELPILKLSEVLARFWWSFIGIHPLADGNRRTAWSFLTSEVETRTSFVVSTDNLVNKVLLTGRLDLDLSKLQIAFLYSIKNKRIKAMIIKEL